MYQCIEGGRPDAHQRYIRKPQSEHHAFQESSKRSTSERPIRWSSSWWWWEISAAGLSLLSTSFIIALLSKIHDMPLSKWMLPFQPNSVLAALTTITKTSLLVPVTACIGQLKWRHFILRPRPLGELQQFDSASRGPWGSATLICSFVFRMRSFTVICLSFATLLTLGIEASSQQIISFEPREVRVANDSVLITRAEAYFSRTWNEFGDGSDDIPYAKSYPGLKDYNEGDKSRQRTNLKATVYSALAGSPLKPYYTCPEPASQCEWDDFSSLGICGRTMNVTDFVVQECSPSNLDATTGWCDFWHPFNDKKLANGSANPTPSNPDPIGFMYDTGKNKNFTMFEYADLNTTASLKSIWTVKVNNPLTSFDGHHFRHFESYTSNLYWCERKSINITASSKKVLKADHVQTTAWAGLDGSAPFYKSFYGGGTSSASTSSFPHFDFDEYIFNEYGELKYNISTPMRTRMRDAVRLITGSGLLFRSNRTWEILERGAGQSQTGISTIAFELSDYMLTHDMETIIQDVADGMTAFMLEPNGDNAMVETVSGYMIYDETRIIVRWVWLLLPALEALVACSLLTLTIFITSGQPLVKNSPIALLAYGFCALDREELLGKSEVVTEERLEKRAKMITAQLERDDLESYRFNKHL